MAFLRREWEFSQRLLFPHLFHVELPDTHSLESPPYRALRCFPCRSAVGSRAGTEVPLHFLGEAVGWEGRETLPGYALVSVGLASVSLSLKPLWENRCLEVLSTGSCSSSDGSGARDFQWLVGLQREEQGQGQIILLLWATKALFEHFQT